MAAAVISGSASRSAAQPDRAAFIREVTHDLKNPLGAAAGYAELLVDGIAGQLTSQQLDMVVHMSRLIHVSLERVSELLDLVHTEAGVIPFTIEEIDASRLVRELVGDYQGEARQKGVMLDAEIPTQPLSVQTDAPAVRRILANLLSNALKFTPARGHVSVSVHDLSHDESLARGGIAIEVRDTGPGIPLELRERIFDLFFRLPSRNGGTPGDGIGLSASRHLARRLGGDITVTNTAAGGAHFTLRLPC